MPLLDQDFTIWAGDNLEIDIPVTDQAGQPLPLVGASATMTITISSGNIEKVGTIAGSTVTVRLLPADSLALPAATYPHSVRVNLSSGETYTVCQGHATVRRS